MNLLTNMLFQTSLLLTGQYLKLQSMNTLVATYILHVCIDYSHYTYLV